MTLSNKIVFYEQDIYEKELESNKKVFYILLISGFLTMAAGLYTLIILLILASKLLLFLALISYINIKHARVMLEIQRKKTKW